MATMTRRGNAFSVVFHYKDSDGNTKQQWETYRTELDAVQRKAHLDYLQRIKDNTSIMKLALEYKQQRSAAEEKKPADPEVAIREAQEKKEDNLTKTAKEFFEKWAPIHARKRQLQPFSYDSLMRNIEGHILPHFGDRVMSTITAQDVDEFLDYLSQKKCRGSKSYNKQPEEVPTLASSSIKKVYDVLYAALPVAKEWGYIKEVPATKAPTVRSKKRKYWTQAQVVEALGCIDDAQLHLAVHLTFVCSLRAGEAMGFGIESIDLKEGSGWVTRTLQRVSDKALAAIPQHEVLRTFPKGKAQAKTQLILKLPKTEDSVRKVYFTEPLTAEIRARLEQIEHDRAYYGSEYRDYGLLFSQPNGDPIEACLMEKWFQDWQKVASISQTIDMQGIRKSAQMYKVRLSGYDYQTVAAAGGHSPAVLMSNYDEAMEIEKKGLAKKVQENFYAKAEADDLGAESGLTLERILEEIQKNPKLLAEMFRSMQPMH